MNPTSRFTGCIAAEQRRQDVLALVATQHEVARHRAQPERSGSRIMHAAVQVWLLVWHAWRPRRAPNLTTQESRAGW